MEYKVFMAGGTILQDTLNHYAKDGWILNSVLQKRDEMRFTVVMERPSNRSESTEGA